MRMLERTGLTARPRRRSAARIGRRSSSRAAYPAVLSLALFSTLAGTGCSGTMLMPVPTVAADGAIDIFSYVPDERRRTIAPVFVASTRQPSGHDAPARFYSNERSREVRLGLATVEIGRDLSWEELARETVATRRERSIPVQLTEYCEFGPLWTTEWGPTLGPARDWNLDEVDRSPAETFLETIEPILANSRHREITVFVHGFNTTFAGNTEIAAEFWHFFRDGVMMSFEWPSAGSLFAYDVDKANAQFAVRQFRLLLQFLAERTSAERINVMAHSAGNPIAVEALRQLSLLHDELDDEAAQRATKIGRVVLAAPDMDLGQLVSAGLDGAGRIVEDTLVYASQRDRALSISGGIYRNVRVGRSIGRLDEDEVAALVELNANWIDVTAAQQRHSTFFGHSYFHTNPWVSSDLLIFTRHGVDGEGRGLVRNRETGFLEFPDDYEERLAVLREELVEQGPSRIEAAGGAAPGPAEK